jgi:hypothetical protein
MPGAVWIGLLILCIALLLEVINPSHLKWIEQFDDYIPVISTKNNFFSQFVHRRGDVGPSMEQGGYVQDPRYFSGYVDIQRFGSDQDFCRMVVPSGADPKETFFACALGGTKDISTVLFRTTAMKDGFKLSRDDYMHDFLNESRAAYCRILKTNDGSYHPMCRRALDTSFSEKDEVDSNPPDETVKLLSFYQGCVGWLRLQDDLLDSVDMIRVQRGGNIKIDETVRDRYDGLRFDGIDEFLRIGDSNDLTLGSIVKLRTVRAFSVWVYMEEFTNNAHFFDFGDGPGYNNTFLGILGKGDPTVADGSQIRESTTVPDTPSGAQFVPEISPQTLMEETRANIDTWTDIDQEVEARKLPPSRVTTALNGLSTGKATLHYEVWDSRQRKVSIKINNMIPVKKWTHIVVTASSADATRPDLSVYVNGEQVYVLPSGFLPQASMTTNNYLGKSNWTNDTSTYELRDELLKGRLYDFRMYKSAMSEKKIKNTIAWGKKNLGI